MIIKQTPKPAPSIIEKAPELKVVANVSGDSEKPGNE